MGSYFLPSHVAIEQERHALAERLRSSLVHMLCEARPEDERTEDLRKLVSSLVPVDGSPFCAVFAWHSRLLDAARKGDLVRFEALTHGAPDLPVRPPKRVSEITPNDLGAAAAAYLIEAFRDDNELTTTMDSPRHEERAVFDSALPDARALLAEYAPDWSAELDVLVDDMLLAVNKDRATPGFAGASVFDAFGAILINPLYQRDAAEVLMTMIHESSHLRMFLFHLEDPVLLNDGAARYKSPLRSRPRPMEGVLHATWVCARMTCASRAILGSYRGKHVDQFAEVERAGVTAFNDCSSVIDEHAEFTDFGHALYRDMCVAVRQA